jgi:glutamyl-Q tRNA(Asp) synthetase
MSWVYTGRFAPSPTGLLHAGSLVAALASYLDARAQGGQWRVRIEDVDTPRCVPGADQAILQQLAACGLVADDAVWWQSQRSEAYALALQTLVNQGWVYPCGCSRKEIESAQSMARHAAAVYPGTCRQGLNGKTARAWRLDVQAVQSAMGLFIIHAGTTVEITDELGEWVKVKLEDGKEGWMIFGDLERI